MQFGKIKPVATIVAQFAAGVETEAIQHEGKLFLPVTTLGTFATKESAPGSTDEVEEVETTSSKPSKPSETSSKKSATKSYDEDELMDIDVKELKGILSDLEIDPDDFDGKNTNKKLRKLILDAQKGTGTTESDEDEDEEEEEEEAPKKKAVKKVKKEAEDDDEDEKSSGSVTSKVEEILDDYDGGKINTKKATAKLAELLSAEPTKVGKLLDEFDDDEDVTITDWSKKFVKKLAKSDDAEDEDEEDEKPAKKSKNKAKKVEEDEDEDLVEISELKKGDRVNVFWADEDNNDWYEGTVKSVKGSKVTVAYDDDTEDVLDPEVNTKIKLLDEE